MAIAEKLSVIHVVDSLQLGGLETLVLEWCRHWRERPDIDAGICALHPGDGLAGQEKYRGIVVRELAPDEARGKRSTIRALTRFFAEQQPDVVHTHNFFAHFPGAIAARRAGIPIVVTTKHGAGMPKLWHSYRLAGRAFRHADAVVPVSEDAADLMRITYRLPPERVRVILNGIDTDRFAPLAGDLEEARQRVLGFTGGPVIGTVCRIIEAKGLPTLLAAFPEVVRAAPEAMLVLVGEGSDRERFEREAREAGLADRVRFLGNRGDVDEIYPLFDVYCLASWSEGISLSILEAGACGVPVVATDIGGNPEILDHGRSGIIVPVRDAAALAGALLRAWRDSSAAAAMGRAVRQRIVETFSIRRMAADYLSLYREIGRRKSGGEG